MASNYSNQTPLILQILSLLYNLLRKRNKKVNFYKLSFFSVFKRKKYNGETYVMNGLKTHLLQGNAKAEKPSYQLEFNPTTSLSNKEMECLQLIKCSTRNPLGLRGNDFGFLPSSPASCILPAQPLHCTPVGQEVTDEFFVHFLECCI